MHFSDNEPLRVMRRWLGQTFSAHTHHGHDMEVANALAICGILGIPATRSFIGLKGREASPAVLACWGY